jgi:hypothetical protein
MALPMARIMARLPLGALLKFSLVIDHDEEGSADVS